PFPGVFRGSGGVHRGMVRPPLPPRIAHLVTGRVDPGECRALEGPKTAMKDPIRQRLEKMTDRFEEVGRLLATADISGGSQQFRDLSVEYARLQPLAARFRGYHNLERDLAAAREMLADPDAGMRTLGAEEITR